jgi:geranylgeranyl diphosphate synthase type II
LSFDLTSYLKAKQTLVDRRLAEALDGAADSPPALVEAMRYCLLAPGKRLRPVLVFMAGHAAGGSDEQALPAAGAVEMIHTYSLIHDDLPAMDDDDLRRGLPACHTRFGDALAILAGDALLTLAFQTLAEAFPAAIAGPCCLELARGAGMAGMVGGQVEDLAWERQAGLRHDPLFPRSEQPHTPSALEHIHHLKTGALFLAALRLGLLAADQKNVDALDAYGRCFGLVFQITDDLLDVEGSAASTGKRVGKDAARGKLTYPGLLGVEESRRQADKLGQDAIASVASFGPAGEPLHALMRYVLERTS